MIHGLVGYKIGVETDLHYRRALYQRWQMAGDERGFGMASIVEGVSWLVGMGVLKLLKLSVSGRLTRQEVMDVC